MNKPICEFLEQYNSKNPIRLHVPGHKGKGFLGCENYDLTEIDGADELYLPTGIIKESQDNASKIFGCPTYYTVEGSSHAIRAMLYLTKIYANKTGKKFSVLSARNVHKSFLSACALLETEVDWIYNEENSNYFSNYLTPEILDEHLKSLKELPCAVFVTSPDYLGNLLDIENLAKVTKKYGLLLLVDNAHGAYLKFVNKHPISLGASICVDSAHKTLPALTGSAYLHLSIEIYNELNGYVETALSLFGTTSPSYLILSSLDGVNEYLEKGFYTKLYSFIEKLDSLKLSLINLGFTLVGNEPLKLSIDAKSYGYTGQEIVEILKTEDIFVEFYDVDYLVLMFTVEILDSEFEKVKKAILSIPKREKIEKPNLLLSENKRALSLKETVYSLTEIVDIDSAVGKVFGDFNLPCPPAVPIIMPGEVITADTIEVFRYYNIDKVKIIK